MSKLAELINSVALMDNQKRNSLNKIENILYIIVMAAIVTDIISGRSHLYVFILSTIILVMAILGIISIELVKLQWKQKQRQ